MIRAVILALLIYPYLSFASDKADINDFLLNIKQLNFEKARHIASKPPDSLLKFEMRQLADLLYYEGQVEKSYFKLSGDALSENEEILATIRALNAGYLSLFYDQLKGEAFKNFYKAYQLSKDLNDDSLIKASLLGLLKYFSFEIAQNSDAYLPFLEHYESLELDSFDQVWTSLYRLIFYTKSLQKLDNYYFDLFDKLEGYEKNIDSNSPLHTKILYEKALKFEIQHDVENSRLYYTKTVDFAGDRPFLRNEKFFALIDLVMIEIGTKNFQAAQIHLANAKKERDRGDTLRSDYYLNLYGSFFYNAQNKNDTAYSLLKQAYAQDFQLDFRRNTLEVNKLSVQLETQEKENLNLRLRQSRLWLTFALVGVGLLFLLSYFAYTNQRSKNRVYQKDQEVQSMKLEKLLKDQEIFGIDAMLAGQEKERQRIANDLHDNLGSLLATVKLHFNNLKTKKNTLANDTDVLYQKTDDLIEEAYQKVRSIAHLKNVGVSAQEGLLPAVKNFATKASVIDKLHIEVEQHGMDKRLDNSLEITIFRIIQELITNIIKHAQATEAVIHLTQYDNAINIMVEDNGIGFEISKIKPKDSMGLYSIQKRIENLGGQVTIDSIAQKGTTVIIDVPLV